MANKVESITECHVNVAPSRFFDTWLEPGKIRHWMAASLREMGLEGEPITVETDPNVGGRFLFSDLRNGQEVRHWGEYRQIRRPQLIEFTWMTDPSEEPDPSIVQLTVHKDAAGSRVRIAHKFDAKWAEMAPKIASSWEVMIRHAASIA